MIGQRCLLSWEVGSQRTRRDAPRSLPSLSQHSPVGGNSDACVVSGSMNIWTGSVEDGAEGMVAAPDGPCLPAVSSPTIKATADTATATHMARTLGRRQGWDADSDMTR